MCSNPRIKAGLLLLVVTVLGSCGPRPSATGIYYWKTTLDWSGADTARMAASGVDRVGLRLFDWGIRGPEGPLVVIHPIPAGLDVVPVVYVTVAKLGAWAADRNLDSRKEALALLTGMDRTLGTAWAGNPRVWQLDADWSAQTRAAWFSVADAFRTLVHDRGGRFEVTVRLHQYRDREAQGIPPADSGVLMLYGTGDAVLDRKTVEEFVRGPAYPIPLVPAYPVYSQVRQYNGYGRLVGLSRLGDGEPLPVEALEPLGAGRYRVLRRADLGGRTLLAHDELVVDRVDPAEVAAVAALPGVHALGQGAGGRVWVFDYSPKSWEVLIHGPLAPYLFSR